MTFQDHVERGRMGERLVCGWMKSQGWGVIPTYEYTGEGGDKAPKLMFESRGLVIPDLDVMRDGGRHWCEVKTYYHAPKNHLMGLPVHGIEQRLLDEYTDVQEASGCQVLLAVLEVQTGDLLMQSLLRFLNGSRPCDCGCALGRRCRAPLKNGPKNGRYYPRKNFKPVASFTDREMIKIRAAWSAPPSAVREQVGLFH